MDVYQHCPSLSSPRFLLRQTTLEDRDDLLLVYSDPAAVPIFNSDNCTGDFHMTTPEQMENCIRFWLEEYEKRYYVRWSILHQPTGTAIGTIELFNRQSQDFYNNVGLLRLDLRSDFETADAITEMMSALLPHAFDLFSCDRVATKIPPCAAERRSALSALGFRYSPERLYGHRGASYGDYYLLEQARF